MDVAPSSLAEVELLIHRMYSGKDPKEINIIQGHLQTLQRSADGWRLADALLASEDATSRFFGALTFTVKLNADGPTLSEADALLILQTLISWLVRLSIRNDSRLALDKLTTTLVTYFVRVSTLWNQPISQILSAFLPTSAPSSVISDLGSLNEQQFLIVLGFATELANELDRVGYNGPAQAKLHNELVQEVFLLASLVKYALVERDGSVKLQQAALKAYQAWTLYSQSNMPGKIDGAEVLRSLTDTALQCLVKPATEEHALLVFTDLLESNTAFFRPQQLDAIASMVQNHFEARFWSDGNDESRDLVPSAQFIVALGNAVVQDVVEMPDSTRSQVLLHVLSNILSTKGIPGDTDELSSLTVEFWCTFCEHVTDTISSHSGKLSDLPWLPHARSVMMQTCRALWQKVWLPPPDVIRHWQDDEMASFRSFRSDVEELFNFMHVTLDLELTNQLVDICRASAAHRQWIAVEAGLDLLSALADSVLEDESGDEPLRRLFSSSLLADVADFNQRMPSQVRKTVITAIGAYGEFIKRNTQFIPVVVRFLFTSLQHSTLANVSARAIQDLCSTCRAHLTADLDEFISQYSTVIALPHIDPYIKEKVIGGVAAIVQALPDDTSRQQSLLILLDYIDNDILAARELAAEGSAEPALTAGLSALNCLASMGRASQTPEDVPVNLYDDDEPNEPGHGYWTSGQGKVVQDRIVRCLGMLEIFGGIGEVVDAVCRVLKPGLKEIRPGPFVLPPGVTTNFLASCLITTPQVESVLTTAALLISPSSAYPSEALDAVLAVFQQAVRFILELEHPSKDPGIAHGCLDIIARMIPRYMSLLLDSPDLQAILSFALQAIEAADLMPKRAALEMSTKLIRASAPTHTVSQIDDGDATKHRAQAVMLAVGGQISQVLVRQVAGVGQRSDLDYVNEPIKALFLALPSHANAWFEAALFSDAFPAVNASIGDSEKRRFLTQLTSLRGGAKTRDVIRNFYVACRGTVSTYS